MWPFFSQISGHNEASISTEPRGNIHEGQILLCCLIVIFHDFEVSCIGCLYAHSHLFDGLNYSSLLKSGFNMQVEATEVFFAVTKLFQSRDIGLRRMVYLMIKEISPSSDEVP